MATAGIDESQCVDLIYIYKSPFIQFDLWPYIWVVGPVCGAAHTGPSSSIRGQAGQNQVYVLYEYLPWLLYISYQVSNKINRG